MNILLYNPDNEITNNFMPHLWMFLLKSLTPPGHKVFLIDGNARKMTRQELKDETKHTEGNPLIKAQQRRRRQALSKRRMLAEVPKADVIVTNPTHLAVALRYDKKTMKAPVIVAKGSRLNALRIREIARQHQVPIIENKPLARLMFKYGRVGGEIPAQFYAVVAEVLAWVYRVNAYRYYREQTQTS